CICFADLIVVGRSRHPHGSKEMFQLISFFPELFDDCCFFALSCAAHLSSLKAISFFITSFSALMYSFSARRRISSSLSDSLSGFGSVDLFISDPSFGFLPFFLSTNPL